MRSPFFSSGSDGDGEDLFGDSGKFLKLVFDADVRDHLAADFAEAREAVGDGEEAVFFNQGDIAGGVPAVVQNFGGFLGAAQIALHHVRPFDEQHARSAGRDRLAGVEVDDFDGDAGKRMADFAAARADLAETRSAEVAACSR